jgi:hypothetical protein
MMKGIIDSADLKINLAHKVGLERFGFKSMTT